MRARYRGAFRRWRWRSGAINIPKQLWSIAISFATRSIISVESPEQWQKALAEAESGIMQLLAA